jgi:hemin uptake protein HemP
LEFIETGVPVSAPTLPPAAPPTPPARPKEIDVHALVGNGREVVLVHKGERYRLRITARDKLILTK